MQVRAYVTRQQTTIVIPAGHPKRDEILDAAAEVLNVEGHYMESDEVRNAIKLDGSEMDQKPPNTSEES